MRDDQIRERIRIIMAVIWIAGMCTTFAFLQRDSKILIITIGLAISALLATDESRVVVAVIEWGVVIAYIAFLGYIIITETYNIILLIAATSIVVIIVIARLKNTSDNWIQMN